MPPSTKTLFGSWTNLHFGDSQLNKPAGTPRIGQVACFITVLSCGLWPLGRWSKWSKDLRTTSSNRHPASPNHCTLSTKQLFPASWSQSIEPESRGAKTTEVFCSLKQQNRNDSDEKRKRDELDDAFPVSSAEIHSTNYLCTCSQHSGLAFENVPLEKM